MAVIPVLPPLERDMRCALFVSSSPPVPEEERRKKGKKGKKPEEAQNTGRKTQNAKRKTQNSKRKPRPKREGSEHEANGLLRLQRLTLLHPTFLLLLRLLDFFVFLRQPSHLRTLSRRFRTAASSIPLCPASIRPYRKVRRRCDGTDAAAHWHLQFLGCKRDGCMYGCIPSRSFGPLPYCLLICRCWLGPGQWFVS